MSGKLERSYKILSGYVLLSMHVSFRSRSQVSLHASRRHNPNFDHMCENCGRVFKCRQNLQGHIKCCLGMYCLCCRSEYFCSSHILRVVFRIFYIWLRIYENWMNFIDFFILWLGAHYVTYKHVTSQLQHPIIIYFLFPCHELQRNLRSWTSIRTS